MTPTTTSTVQVNHDPLSPFGRIVEAPAGTPITDITVDTLASWTVESRVLVLRGFQLMPTQEFADYCRRCGEVLKWEPGEVIDLVVQENPKNYLFASGDVPFHWDGAFVEANPRYFFFQCLDATPGAGGETVFCDTTAVYRDADAKVRDRWAGVRLTYSTDKLAHYGGKVTEDMVSRHPSTGMPVLRFAEPLDPNSYANPVFVAVDGIPSAEVDDFLTRTAELLHQPRYCYHHEWQRGDIVIADNFALVHGRNAFTGPTSRHLQRVEVI